MRLFYFLPGFNNLSGHDNIFVEIFKKYKHKNKNKIEIIIPTSNKLNFDITNHKIITKNSNFLFVKILNLVILVSKIISFSKNSDFNYQDIILIDGGSYDQQLSIALGVFLSKRKTKQIFIYCRKNEKKYSINGLIFMTILFFLNASSKEELILLTDNTPLGKVLEINLKYKTFIMPIPHVLSDFGKYKNLHQRNYSELTLWIPGPIRKDKVSTT